MVVFSPWVKSYHDPKFLPRFSTVDLLYRGASRKKIGLGCRDAKKVARHCSKGIKIFASLYLKKYFRKKYLNLCSAVLLYINVKNINIFNKNPKILWNIVVCEYLANS